MNKKTKNGIITASIVAIGVYAIYKIFNKSSKTNIGVVVNGVETNTNPTLTQEKYKEIADKIFDAMGGWGTNTTALYNNFSLLKNNDDLMELVKAYGIREVPNGLFNPLPDFKGNLSEAIGSELGQQDITTINSILVKNGINIRFNKSGELTTI